MKHQEQNEIVKVSKFLDEIEERRGRHVLPDDKYLKSFQEQFDRRYEEIMFIHEEAGVGHHSYEWADSVYDAVKNHDMDLLRTLLTEQQSAHGGVFSHDDMRNAKTLGACAISVVTDRILGDQLMGAEEAYSASDACLQMLEEAGQIGDIIHIIYASLFRLSELILHARGNRHNPLITRARALIHNHMHEQITVSALADALHVTPEHLSRTFRAAEGIPISRYIRDEKIKRAKHALRFSDMSIAQIGRMLGYSTQSHFTCVFKASCNMTPDEYRRRFARQKKE